MLFLDFQAIKDLLNGYRQQLYLYVSILSIALENVLVARFIDATSLKVCHNRRISNHKVFVDEVFPKGWFSRSWQDIC